ncbi:hypothetical protein Q8F55_008308 [Vanrija albida]|uniref:Fork-head domain-containing protein n=1 Tax=Vanrija albida TaxID=181172 RepID=A0ABR3PVV8_9TREE
MPLRPSASPLQLSPASSRSPSLAPTFTSSTASLPAPPPAGSIRTHAHVVRALTAPGLQSDIAVRLVLESYVAYKMAHGRNKWQMSAKLLRLEYSFPAHARVHRVVRAYFALPESAYAQRLFAAGVAAEAEYEADGEWAPVPPPAYKCKPPGYACAGIEPAPPTYAPQVVVEVDEVVPKLGA